MSLGVFLAIFCHFILRDNLIWFFERVIDWQRANTELIFNNQDDEDDKQAKNNIVNVNHRGLKKVEDATL